MFSAESDRDGLSEAIKAQIRKLEEEMKGVPSEAELTARRSCCKQTQILALTKRPSRLE